MKRSDIRRLIKTAYDIQPTKKKTAFLRAHRQYRRNTRQLLMTQIQYMGPQLTVLGGYALAMLLAAAVHIDAGMAQVLSSLMPAVALVAMTGLGRSERHGMAELEAATRFSLRMIRLLRLAVIGAVALVLMVLISCVLTRMTGTDLLRSFAFVGVPYLMTTFLCMLLTRKWHSRKNIYGCIAVALTVCLLTLGGTKLLLLCAAGLSRSLPAAALAVSALLTVCEAGRYIKESEETQWNLC